jgi:hypothetical protein
VSDWRPSPLEGGLAEPARPWDRAAALSAAMGLTAGPFTRLLIFLARKAGQWPSETGLLLVWIVLGVWLVIGLTLGVIGARRTMRDPTLRGGLLCWLGIIANSAWIVLNAFQVVKHYRDG